MGSMADKREKRKYEKQEPVSLAPLELDAALKALLKVKPDDVDDTPPKPSQAPAASVTEAD